MMRNALDVAFVMQNFPSDTVKIHYTKREKNFGNLHQLSSNANNFMVQAGI
jgi:hypothetical protein